MDLQSGIGFITLAMAMFAIPETLFLVLDPSRSGKAGSKQSDITNLRITKDEAKKIAPVIGRQQTIHLKKCCISVDQKNERNK